MKLIKEHIILEKFIEDSDPIYDIGIGIYGLLKNEYNKIAPMDYDERAKYLFKNKFYQGAGTAVKALLPLIIEDKLIDKKNINKLEKTLDNIRKNYGLSEFGVNIVIEYFKDKFDIKLPAFHKQIHEKFIEDSDPIDDLGIGLRREFEKYIEMLRIPDIKKYEFGSSLKGYDALLVQAAMDGKYDVINYLLNVKRANAKGKNSLALRWAAVQGKLKIVKLLIEHGANVNDEKNDALICAISGKRIHVIKYLLNKTNIRIQPKHLDYLKHNTEHNSGIIWPDLYKKALELYDKIKNKE